MIEPILVACLRELDLCLRRVSENCNFKKSWILPLWKSYSYDKHTNNKTVFIQQSNQHLEGFTFSIIKRFKLHWKVHFERQINYQRTHKKIHFKDAHNFEELCSRKGQGFYLTILFTQSLGILRVWGLLWDGHGEGRRGGRHSAPALVSIRAENEVPREGPHYLLGPSPCWKLLLALSQLGK